MRLYLLTLFVVAPAFPSVCAQAPGTKILLAFASTRERRDPPYPKVYFYEHDGAGAGKLVGSVESVTGGTNKTRADMHPSLSHDGRFCAFSAQFGVTDGACIQMWDRKESKLVPLPAVQETPKVHQMCVSLAGDGRTIAYHAWARPGSTSRWGVFLYDVATKKSIDPPRLNRETSDQRMPALSADGRVLAFSSNAPGGVGSSDIYLYDLAAGKLIAVPEMNSKGLELQPALSGDGRLVAFSSDRPGGLGGRDIYLFDRVESKLLPLPGLNSSDPEQSPSLSADGRYLAFVSERLSGAGERDIYLYDRQIQKLLPTPGFNHKEDDFDPSIVVFKMEK
jgi:hypothetical protein